jgi:polysulfide reductase chain C
MEPQTVWGALIAWYLFLAGVGAGAYLISAVGQFVDARVRPLSNVGVLVGPPLVAIGCLLLLLDLGRPERFLFAYLQPFSSMIALGTWILSVFLVVGFVQIALLVLPPLKGKASGGLWRALWAIGSVTAIGTAVYTGVLLGVVKVIPFWNTPVLPLLFLVSATSTGAGAVFLAAPLYRAIFGGKEAEEAVHSVSRLDLGLVVAELVVLFFYLAIMAATGPAAAASVALLTSGGYALAFWLGVVVVGLLLPLALEAVTMRNEKGSSSAGAVTMLAAACLLVGGLILRYAVLGSGIPSPIG